MRNFFVFYIFRCWYVSPLESHSCKGGTSLHLQLLTDDGWGKRSNFVNLEKLHLAIIITTCIFWIDVKIGMFFTKKWTDGLFYAAAIWPSQPVTHSVPPLFRRPPNQLKHIDVAANRKECILFAPNWFTRISRFKHGNYRVLELFIFPKKRNSIFICIFNSFLLPVLGPMRT